MRKRNKTARGSRSGRGNSRVNAKSGSISKNVSESSPSTVEVTIARNGLNGINSCYIRSPTTRGRRGGSGNSIAVASSIHHRSPSSSSSRLATDYARSAVGFNLNFDLANDNNSPKAVPISSDYYLHKKFKKLTTTLSTENDEGQNESGGACGGTGDNVSAGGSDIVISSGLNNHKKNPLCTDNHLVPSNDKPNQKNLNIVSNSKSSSDETNCSSSQSNHATNPSTISQILPVSLTNVNNSTVNLPHGVSASNSTSSSNANSTVVYKPKFRIAPDTIESVPPSKPSLSSSSSISSSDELSLTLPDSSTSLPLTAESTSPGRIRGELRMDRQSLDDRISKIIDENQSILSHWPEHLTKRLKSHVQKRQQQQQQNMQLQQNSNSNSISQGTPRNCSSSSSSDNNNPLVIMSGGSTAVAESPLGSVVPNNFSSHIGISLKQPINMSSPVLSTIQSAALIRSHSDVTLGGPNNIAEQNKKFFGDNFSEWVSSGSNAGSSSGSSNTSSTVVPKKRRRLSPTPNRLCGGEVSELPSHETIKSASVSGRNQTGSFQDVDMTVRMSNCGTSGAKVTIRTNSSSSNCSNNSSNGTNGSGTFNYNRLMDVPSSPLKLQSVSSSPPSNSSHSNIQPSSLLMRAGSSYFDIHNPDSSHIVTLSSRPSADAVPVDLKVGKSSGRPPKKGRSVEPLQIPGPDPSPKLSVIVSPSPSVGEPRVTKMPLESPLPFSILKSPAAGITALSLPSISVDSSSSVSDMNASAIKKEPTTPIPSLSDKDTDNFLSPAKTLAVSPKPLVLQSTAPNPKRPTFLALKPMNAPPKTSVPGALPSPETPRGAKSYNQMYINGHAYTSLVFKVSTRSSYTCLFKPQPMFLVQGNDHKLSMYSNWQPRPRNKNQDDVSTPQNDSRVNDRKSPHNFIFSTAGKDKCGLTETVNSPDQQSTRWALTSPTYSPSSSPTTATPTPSPSTSIKVTNDSTPSPSASSFRQTELSIPQSPLMMANTSGKNSKLPIAPSSPAIPLTTSTPFPAKAATLSDPVLDYSNDHNSNLSHPLDFFTGNAAIKDKFVGGSFEVNNKRKHKIIVDSPGESPCSSADESNMSFSGRFSKAKASRSRTSSPSLSVERPIRGSMSSSGYQDQDGPLSLTVKSGSSINHNSNSSNSHRDFRGGSVHSNDDDGDDDRHSVGIIDGRFENPRVRIMEGGFESNEDYTYVRGRGRGRYVCEACGIRCKKPSMLRKHLKTHTDLRPYTCKLCNFSFKTKGNLTKHQKSKSHHKKCIGLGIHPNSSRSLAMSGPMSGFSDTNTDDSEDEDDPGIYNGGDTDSQEDIDTEELSSSAEPDQMNRESHSVENEIAQSLLDLSRINRIPRETGGSGSGENRAIVIDSPLKSIQNQRLIQHTKVNGYSPRNLVIDENSCSQASMGSNTTEVPIDLSCRSKTISTSSTNEVDDEGDNSDFKRLKLEKSRIIRSFGVVGEAQRWEPEEEFLITGCLNLKKIPNESNSSEGKSCPSLPSSNNLIPADVKPEIRSLNLCANNNIGEKSFDLKLDTKRKRESSTSSSCGGENYLTTSLPQSPPKQLPSTALASPLPHGIPTSTNSSGPSIQSVPNSSSKQQKLHQPWLSPRDSKSTENAVGKLPVVETPISPSLNVERAENKVLETLDKSREPISRPALTNDHSGQNNLPHVSVSNASSFSSLVGLKPQAEFRQPSGPQALVKGEGKAECNVCGKGFSRASQLNLHMNIHYLERPFRCDPCGVSFRTKGHLIKHRRSSSHEGKVKVYLTESWGVANEENPRPFKCPDCKIAFRIHGHLAKHLRSKMHIMRMECLGKLPFGIYFEMEKSGLNLTEIDTSDCDMSLISLQGLAKKIYGDTWTDRLSVPVEEPI